MITKEKLFKIEDLQPYFDYSWEEESIGCSNEVVFKLSKDNEVLFLKAGKAGALINEYLNLVNLKGVLNVPSVVFYYKKDIEIIITTKMDGIMSCEDECLEDKDSTIDALCFAIKQIQNIELNDDLFAKFNVYTLEGELEKVYAKFEQGEISALPDKVVFNRFKTIEQVIEYFKTYKPKGELYFSHGDVSMPNVFMKSGKFVGFIDVGSAGIRQKWQDIADAYISVRRNFESQEVADEFLCKLGIIDKTDIEYYEMLIYLL